ncbi:RNA transcription, translation and transport factor protein, partial [Lamellibrachia satsuma]
EATSYQLRICPSNGVVERAEHSQTAIQGKHERQFRNLIVWLEDQKIRHYKIEDREALRNTDSETWPDAFSKYNSDICNPVALADRDAALDWLLGFAVKLDYGDNVKKYEGTAGSGDTTEGRSKTTSSNPLEGIDFDSADFKAGVKSLATLLQIPTHPDHLQLLKRKTFRRCDEENKASCSGKSTSTGKVASMVSIPLSEVELGFKTDDDGTAEAAKILRLLHIHDLRDLQDNVNQAIVAVQQITANPKTDTKLGKVGF